MRAEMGSTGVEADVHVRRSVPFALAALSERAIDEACVQGQLTADSMALLKTQRVDVDACQNLCRPPQSLVWGRPGDERRNGDRPIVPVANSV